MKTLTTIAAFALGYFVGRDRVATFGAAMIVNDEDAVGRILADLSIFDLPSDELERRRDEAVSRGDYESAAMIRDILEERKDGL